MSSAHENLVILLHGVGSNGADFAALGKALQGFLPDAAFAPPNAPILSTGAGWDGNGSASSASRPPIGRNG